MDWGQVCLQFWDRADERVPVRISQGSTREADPVGDIYIYDERERESNNKQLNMVITNVNTFLKSSKCNGEL